LKTSLAKTFQHPEVKKMLTQIGYAPVYKDAEEFSRFVKEEESKLTQIAKEANIKID
jgi:tripartite-type tricarboxylate transporter receptor subunit TctC